VWFGYIVLENPIFLVAFMKNTMVRIASACAIHPPVSSVKPYLRESAG
jgi:hypothetical protein